VTAVRPAGAPPASLANLAPDMWTQPFWTAAAQHRLVCQLHKIESVPLSGQSTVYHFKVVRKSSIPQLAEGVPT
jgi:hypothetical protein